MKNNKQIVLEFLEKLKNSDQKALDFLSNDFIQFNTQKGKEVFNKFFEKKIELKLNPQRILVDNEWILVHSLYQKNEQKYITMDAFKLQDGKIKFHLDTKIKDLGPNLANRTQADGTEEISSNNTNVEKNKKFITDFLNTIVINGEFNKIENFIKDDFYIQHAPYLGDGSSGLAKGFAWMEKNNITVHYKEVKKIFVQGNFVSAFSVGTLSDKKAFFWNLWRIENNAIVEHWEILTNDTILFEKDKIIPVGKFN